MTGFTKLFGAIVASSIWDCENATRIVWITMLALKDRHHVVQATLKSLALFSRVTEDEARVAVAAFEAPDPKSRTKAFDGRRIEPVEGGWLILNGEKYRQMLSKAERTEYSRVKQAEYRRRKKGVKHRAACDGAQQAIDEGFAPMMGRGGA